MYLTYDDVLNLNLSLTVCLILTLPKIPFIVVVAWFECLKSTWADRDHFTCGSRSPRPCLLEPVAAGCRPYPGGHQTISIH